MRIALLHLYTVLSYALLYPFTFINTILILLLDIAGLKHLTHYIVQFWAYGTFFLVSKSLKIKGKENLSKNRRYLIIANHSSMFDIMCIMAICPDVSWFGKAHLMSIPVFGKLLKTINYIPMKSTDLRNTKKMLAQLVEKTQNHSVAIFPEGTRTQNGEMNKFRKGFLYVLRASKLDILPVSLSGFYTFKPKNRFYFNYAALLSAKLHTVIPYKEIENMEDKDIISLVHSTIESAILNE